MTEREGESVPMEDVPVTDTETEEETPVDEGTPIEEEPRKTRWKLHRESSSGNKTWETVKAIPNRAYSRMYDWLWGTEEKPLHPFSIRGKFKRWFMIKYRGYCYLIMTMYDKIEDEYVYTREIIPRRELPRDAVHVTGVKNTYHIDLLLKKRGFSSLSDNGFTAVDAFLYMKCNKIDEAMAIKLDSDRKPIETQKLLGILAIGVGAIFAVMYLMQ